MTKHAAVPMDLAVTAYQEAFEGAAILGDAEYQHKFGLAAAISPYELELDLAVEAVQQLERTSAEETAITNTLAGKYSEMLELIENIKTAPELTDIRQLIKKFESTPEGTE